MTKGCIQDACTGQGSRGGIVFIRHLLGSQEPLARASLCRTDEIFRRACTVPAIGRLLDVHGPACDDHLLGISGPYTDSDTIPRIEIRIRIGKVEIDFLRNRHNYTFLKWSMSDVGRAACRLVARHGAPHNALSPSRRLAQIGSDLRGRISSHFSISSLISHEHLKALTPSACNGLVISVDAELLSRAMAAELC